MEQHFSDLVDVRFTARMEDDLDEISLGKVESVPYLRAFYFGAGGEAGLKQLLETEIDPRASRTLELGKDENGTAVEIRIGRYGPYLERGEERGPIPADLLPDELTLEKALELIAKGGRPAELGSTRAAVAPCTRRTGASARTCSSARMTKSRR